ncbi:casein kinase 2 regulatory subunit, partial [Spiromyces aspiralis]
MSNSRDYRDITKGVGDLMQYQDDEFSAQYLDRAEELDWSDYEQFCDDNDDDDDEDDDNDNEGDDIDTGSEEISWISWFCSLNGHEYFCEVPEDFIEDEFNLTGISQMVHNYNEAIDRILDIEDDYHMWDEAKRSMVDQAAEVVYGLIHARYIVTRNGLNDMAEKFENCEFGICPRTGCKNSLVVPCGVSDVLGVDSVKLYCPNCIDVYTPPNRRLDYVDSAFFGTTFPHLFFLTFPDYLPPRNMRIYKPKIFGFNISEVSAMGRRMQWLRLLPDDDRDGNSDSDAHND